MSDPVPAERPILSIVVPVRNEVAQIPAFLDSLLAQDLAVSFEILVVDGESEDRSRDMVLDYAGRNPRIRLLRNPKRITPAALNVGICAARGEYVIVGSTHWRYPPDYLRICLETIESTGADNVGHLIRIEPGGTSLMARAIGHVQQCPFGIGGNLRRFGGKGGFSHELGNIPVGGFVFRRAIFARVGLFNESLLRNHDNELISRIHAKGGVGYFTPETCIRYHTRRTLRSFLHMLWRNGLFHPLVWRTNPDSFKWRHCLPFLFVSTLVLSMAIGFVWRPAWLAGAFALGAHLVLSGVNAWKLSRRHGYDLLWVTPWLFFLMHTMYGLGTLAGIVRFGFVPVTEPSQLQPTGVECQ